MTSRCVAVVGAGWAGISAAVHARLAGHQVQLYDMAGQPGGRARTVTAAGHSLDNGQHILIGAYAATLELMQIVQADAASLLYRMPLTLTYPDGTGLRLRPGRPMSAFTKAVLGRRGWPWTDRLMLLLHAARWAWMRFDCPAQLSVAHLCAGIGATVRRQLIEPLCVAALNTPAESASAKVFLRVLHDALFSGPGSSDLLLPTAGLGALLPQPAMAWFRSHDIRLRATTRVMHLRADGDGWRVDDEYFDAVILACSAHEAARLCALVAPEWAAATSALHYEPIITVYLQCPGARLANPMMALHAGEDAPAQFVFDLGALGTASDVFAFVISGARAWVERGAVASAEATLAQAATAFPMGTWPQPPTLLHVATEKRATFRCTPGLVRPAAQVAARLWAAGDYVAGPYPATLEGAVRSGRSAALAVAPAR